jgi:hypothetical protein
LLGEIAIKACTAVLTGLVPPAGIGLNASEPGPAPTLSPAVTGSPGRVVGSDKLGTSSAPTTGGTNWQKYLPPRFQKRIFYPELWTAQEHEDWGKGWVETNVFRMGK